MNKHLSVTIQNRIYILQNNFIDVNVNKYIFHSNFHTPCIVQTHTHTHKNTANEQRFSDLCTNISVNNSVHILSSSRTSIWVDWILPLENVNDFNITVECTMLMGNMFGRVNGCTFYAENSINTMETRGSSHIYIVYNVLCYAVYWVEFTSIYQHFIPIYVVFGLKWAQWPLFFNLDFITQSVCDVAVSCIKHLFLQLLPLFIRLVQYNVLV